MENYQPKETGDGEMGTGDWRLGTGRDEAGKRAEERITPHSTLISQHSQSSIPKTELLLYLVPIIGFFPSLWTLYRRQGSREQLAVSRLSITLALTWLLGYLLLVTGAATSDFFTLRLFILNSFLTSGYFLVSVWLIFRLIHNKSGRLPGFTTFAERVVGKYLS
ncbi:hypothetical protein [Nostoc sp. PA-18-2419]|uniref:hypothetical protein n=1 Tax=Nostoc sp. PA-18-2419 TaxID=2575443 RepID=UPI001CB97A0A|nr:hypothetical protein [Nostoc sp. PA-18-2419]